MALEEIVSYLEKRITRKPEVGIILGSGLGALADEISEPAALPYGDIPSFPRSTVAGHGGRFVMGWLEGKYVLCMQGRFHYYEGYDIQQVVLPVRVMQKLGINLLLVTNAAGGINETFEPGTLMVIDDHIDLTETNPLRGKNDDSLGPRFPDMSEAYDMGLRERAFSAARELGIAVKRGVYAGLSGPNYETPAEIRYLRIIGADAVGMSTVPEVITANHGGMKVLGISCITNMAAGISKHKLNHQEVTDTANKVRDKFVSLLKKIISGL